EIIMGPFHLTLVVHVPISDIAAPDEVVDEVDTLQVHRDSFQAVGQLQADRTEGKAADLLKVGELRYFHPIEPDLPAQARGPQGGRLPVILDKADIVIQGVDAKALEALQVYSLRIGGRRLKNHLVLIIV